MSFKLSLLVEILPQKSLFPRAELLNARLYKNVASMGIIPGRGLVFGADQRWQNPWRKSR